MHKISSAREGDFTVDKKYVFEIGGKGKTSDQVRHLKNAYLAIDDIEIGFENRIPLWLYGFLY